jgi:predicted nucleic acid-binding protein
MRQIDRVIVDTSALYALASSTDEFHNRARQTYSSLLEGEDQLWVSSYVLVEFGAVVHRRLGFAALQAFYESFEPVSQTFWVDKTMHAEAWSELDKRQGQGLSLVDWTVLLAARQLGARIFTFDAGFGREGGSVIPEASL